MFGPDKCVFPKLVCGMTERKIVLYFLFFLAVTGMVCLSAFSGQMIRHGMPFSFWEILGIVGVLLLLVIAICAVVAVVYLRKIANRTGKSDEMKKQTEPQS